MSRRIYPSEFLRKQLFGTANDFGAGEPPEVKIIEDERIVAHHRWTVEREVIFEHDGKTYRTTYHVPATESVHIDDPWFTDEVECEEVRQAERKVKVWEPVDNERWGKAVEHARHMFDVYRTTPHGEFAAALIAAGINRYENGDRSDDLLEALEGIR